MFFLFTKHVFLDVISVPYLKYTLHLRYQMNKYLKNDYNWLTFLIFYLKTYYGVSTHISLKHTLYCMFMYVSIVFGSNLILP